MDIAVYFMSGEGVQLPRGLWTVGAIKYKVAFICSKDMHTLRLFHEGMELHDDVGYLLADRCAHSIVLDCVVGHRQMPSVCRVADPYRVAQSDRTQDCPTPKVLLSLSSWRNFILQGFVDFNILKTIMFWRTDVTGSSLWQEALSLDQAPRVGTLFSELRPAIECATGCGFQLSAAKRIPSVLDTVIWIPGYWTTVTLDARLLHYRTSWTPGYYHVTHSYPDVPRMQDCPTVIRTKVEVPYDVMRNAKAKDVRTNALPAFRLRAKHRRLRRTGRSARKAWASVWENDALASLDCFDDAPTTDHFPPGVHHQRREHIVVRGQRTKKDMNLEAASWQDVAKKGVARIRTSRPKPFWQGTGSRRESLFFLPDTEEDEMRKVELALQEYHVHCRSVSVDLAIQFDEDLFLDIAFDWQWVAQVESWIKEEEHNKIWERRKTHNDHVERLVEAWGDWEEEHCGQPTRRCTQPKRINSVTMSEHKECDQRAFRQKQSNRNITGLRFERTTN